jgi:hypothetical protein
MKSLLRAVAIAASFLIGAALAPVLAQAQASGTRTPTMAELLFVQSAAGVEIDAAKKTMTLKGLSPTTLFFSDRPVRIAGHYRTEEYLQFWKAGPDSFLKDPPNATLSVFEKGKEEMSDVVVTLRNPRVSGNEITYDVAVISGTLPKGGGPASLFIDIIGLPFTPLSFAGVARRTAYRTAVYGSAAAAAHYYDPYPYYHPYPYYSPPAPFSVQPVTTPPVTYTAPVPPPVAVTETPQGPLPIGTVVTALPAGCVTSPKDGIAYYDCAGVYYRAAVQGESIRYMVVQRP